MIARVNAQAGAYATTFDLPVPGGPVAHVMREVGSVVTGAPADSVEAFLDGILAGESSVVGSSSGLLSRGISAGVIACNYLPYLVTALHSRLRPHAARLGRTMRRVGRSR